MPVFFVVGGYANALSRTRHQAEGSPGGDVPAGVLAAYGCGVILTLAAGRLASGMTVTERPV
jgi:hypothetical protein